MTVTVETIMQYLKSELPSPLDAQTLGLVQELRVAQTELDSTTSLDWQALGRRRLMGSNSMLAAKHDSLATWDLANQWVQTQILSEQAISFQQVINLNRLLNPQSQGLRTHRIFTADEEYLPPQHLAELAIDFDKLVAKLADHPLQLACEVYVWISTLHPFSDGNGRTARLCADWVLMAGGYLPLCFDTPIAAHVAQCLNGPVRNKAASYHKFLSAVRNSYRIIMTPAQS